MNAGTKLFDRHHVSNLVKAAKDLPKGSRVIRYQTLLAVGLISAPAYAGVTVSSKESTFGDGRPGLQSFTLDVSSGKIGSYTQDGVTFAGSNQVGKNSAACGLTTGGCLAETSPFTVSYTGPVLGLRLYNQNGVGRSTTLNYTVTGSNLSMPYSGSLTISGHQSAFIEFDLGLQSSTRVTFTPSNPTPGQCSNIEIQAFAIAAPEPATWGLMIVGFGAAGIALRRGRKKIAVAYA